MVRLLRLASIALILSGQFIGPALASVIADAIRPQCCSLTRCCCEEGKTKNGSFTRSCHCGCQDEVRPDFIPPSVIRSGVSVSPGRFPEPLLVSIRATRVAAEVDPWARGPPVR